MTIHNRLQQSPRNIPDSTSRTEANTELSESRLDHVSTVCAIKEITNGRICGGVSQALTAPSDLTNDERAQVAVGARQLHEFAVGAKTVGAVAGLVLGYLKAKDDFGADGNVDFYRALGSAALAVAQTYGIAKWANFMSVLAQCHSSEVNATVDRHVAVGGEEIKSMSSGAYELMVGPIKAFGIGYANGYSGGARACKKFCVNTI